MGGRGGMDRVELKKLVERERKVEESLEAQRYLPERVEREEAVLAGEIKVKCG